MRILLFRQMLLENILYYGNLFTLDRLQAFLCIIGSTVYQFALSKYSKQLLPETGFLEIAGSGDCGFWRPVRRTGFQLVIISDDHITYTSIQ